MRNIHFIHRTLLDILGFFKEALYADEFAARPGFLQARDPRINVLAIFLFLLLTLFTKSFFVLGSTYLVCLILVALSKINLLYFIKRTWIFIPLFSLCIALPAIFDFVTPGRAIALMRTDPPALIEIDPLIHSAI